MDHQLSDAIINSSTMQVKQLQPNINSGGTKNHAKNKCIISFIRTAIFVAIITILVFALFYHNKTRSSSLSSSAITSGKNPSRSVLLKDSANGASPGSSSSSRLFLQADPEGVVLDDIQAYRSNLLIKRRYDAGDVEIRPVTFNVNTSDVMVVLHIQKTGGTTFENHLVQNTNVQPPCQCEPMYGGRIKCHCWNSKGQDWLFNRHSVGWACGVHADFTELTTCVDQWYRSQENEERMRKYRYVTLIRDPVNRFLSEWQHVRRGATWKECRLHCDGRDATLEEVPFCFHNGNWSTVTFEEFLQCPHNMAFNRQTRMLANMSLSDCYRIHSDKTKYERDEIMLQSAKDNLQRFFDFFGILEYSYECQALFQKTFKGLKFKKKISPKRGSLGMNYVLLSEDSWNRIIELNSLDVRLYQYAKDLFFQRLRRARIPVERKSHECKYVGDGFTYTTIEMNCLVFHQNGNKQCAGTLKIGNLVNREEIQVMKCFKTHFTTLEYQVTRKKDMLRRIKKK